MTAYKSAFYSIKVRKENIQGEVCDSLLKEEDRAWLAGIVEGEGSVLWASYGNSEWRAKISIYMNDGEVITRAAQLMASHAWYDKKRKRWHTYAEGFRAVQVAKLLAPHMIGQKKNLANRLTEIGHIFRGSKPPWHFSLHFDKDLQKNVRTIEFQLASSDQTRRWSSRL